MFGDSQFIISLAINFSDTSYHSWERKKNHNFKFNSSKFICGSSPSLIFTFLKHYTPAKITILLTVSSFISSSVSDWWKSYLKFNCSQNLLSLSYFTYAFYRCSANSLLVNQLNFKQFHLPPTSFIPVSLLSI